MGATLITGGREERNGPPQQLSEHDRITRRILAKSRGMFAIALKKLLFGFLENADPTDDLGVPPRSDARATDWNEGPHIQERERETKDFATEQK